ncbi:flagellar basal body P-ring formation chaperone FlgA [Hydrogenimonas sp.]
MERDIADAFKKHYPTLRIKNLSLETTSKKDTFAYTPDCKLRLGKSVLRKHKGSLVVKCGRRSHFLKYLLDADIVVYKAAHQIKKDKMVASESLMRVVVPFRSMRDTPITDAAKGRYIARQNIVAGKVVTRKMVAPVPEVRKHDRVRCVYRDGPVFVEFDAEALQNGYKGDTVTLKKGDGKTLRGVVTGTRSVEIR